MITQAESQKLWTLIEPLKVGMLVSGVGEAIHARPMHLVQKEFSGSIYFFTDSTSFKVTEILENPQVCLAFSCPKAQTYVSISGTASVCEDQTLIDQFWNPFIAAWFPQGKDDPTVVLLEIKTFKAEHWNATDNKIVQLYEYAKALVTGKQPDMGEHGETH